MKIQGLEAMAKRLDALSRNLDALGGTHDVPINELFPSSFMLKHTTFRSFDEMLDASGFPVKTTSDFAAIPDAEWNAFVVARTRFTGWEEMKGKAAEQWVASKLEL